VTPPPIVPPAQLAARIGGSYDEYVDIGAAHRVFIESLLPAGWSFDGKSVLDFGCGTGRTMAAFSDRADEAEFHGCDIDADSIAWATSELSPPFNFFLCQETPPLDQPDGRFDLIYGMSVFTHITEHWSEWITELHRVMREGGVAVFSVLGPAMSHTIVGTDWDPRIGMASVDLHKDWNAGGPDVLLAEWWVREHWGRAFEILRFDHCDPAVGAGHDLVALRRREVAVTPEGLAEVDMSDPREYESVVCNLELLARQQARLGTQLREQEAARITDLQRVETEMQQLASKLDAVTQSKSWRFTGPLRRAMVLARENGRRST
jgi:SAM-dependent methyltransferase